MTDLPTVLVVEDEALIRDVVEETLNDGGFKVVLAASGEEAKQLIDAPGSHYDALVTDINLGQGRLTGWDFAQHAREVHAHLAVVYMTGANAAEWHAQGVPNSVLLNKPFAAAQLLTAVAQLLNSSGSGRGR